MISPEQAKSIKTKEDLVNFIKLLVRDLKDDPDSWENSRLDRYLDALSAWTEDMEGFFANVGEPFPETPNWRLIGIMLLAAKRYE